MKTSNLFIVLTILILSFGTSLKSFAATNQEKPAVEEKVAEPDIFLNMEREIDALRQFADKEAKTTLDILAQEKDKLLPELAELRKKRTTLEESVTSLHKKFLEQQELLMQLEQQDTVQQAGRKTLEGAIKLSVISLRERFAKNVLASVLPTEQLDILTRLMGNDLYPSYQDVRDLTDLSFAELNLQKKFSVQKETVGALDGSQIEAEVFRAGGLLSIAKTVKGDYFLLQAVDGGRRLAVATKNVPDTVHKMLKVAFVKKLHMIPADFSGGAIFKQFKEKRGFLNHLLAGGFLVWPILLLGLGAMGFGLCRLWSLSQVRLGQESLLQEFFLLVRQGQFTAGKEYLTHKSKDAKAPVYTVLWHMLANWNGKIQSLEKCRDEALLLHLIPLEKGITFIAVAAAVAPLLGLLGTVTGMIATFDTITMFGNSDPKMLSGGISVALVTTEIGLIVAIPLMLVHYLLSRTVDAISDDMDEKAAILIARATIGTTAIAEEQKPAGEKNVHS